jgi:hypothetical protein
MNENYLNYGGSSAAIRILVGDVSVIAGLGKHRVRVQASISTANERADGDTFTFTGDVSAAGLATTTDGYLGTIIPTLPQTIHRDGNWPASFIVELTDEQFRKIEERRTNADGSFEVVLLLRLEAIDASGTISRAENRLQPLRVKREDWLNMLNQIGFRHVLVAELDIPDSATRPEHARAVDFYAQAQARFAAGDYRGAAESIRQSLAALVGQSPDEETDADTISAEIREASKRSHGDRVGYDERMELARRVLKFVADISAHPEAGDTKRAEALAQLHMAAGLLQWFERT